MEKTQFINVRNIAIKGEGSNKSLHFDATYYDETFDTNRNIRVSIPNCLINGSMLSPNSFTIDVLAFTTTPDDFSEAYYSKRTEFFEG